MRPNSRYSWAATILVLQGLLGTIQAQETHVLRYAPDTPMRVNLVSRSEIVMKAIPSGPRTVDTLTVEATRLESATQYADAAEGGRYSIELHYDSVRARMRPVGGLWRQLEASEKEVATVRALLDERMRVLQAEFLYSPHLQDSSAHLTRGLTGGVLLTLPAEPVAVGVPWATDVAYPLSALGGIGREEGVPEQGELRSLATAVLDSVVRRGDDILYYVTARGTFAPMRYASTLGGDRASIVAAGSFAAMAVWSSRWSAFVSSASRVLAQIDVQDPLNTATVSQVRFDVIIRAQVRM